MLMTLTKYGKLLFNENQNSHLNPLKNLQIDHFIELKQDLVSKLQSSQQKAINMAASVLEFIIECGLEYSDFPRETLPNHFKKIQKGNFEPATLYNNKLEENLVEGKILKSGISLPSEDIALILLDNYQNIKEIIYQIAFLKNAYNNTVPLTILNAIQQEINILEEERDQLPITSFNKIISNEIKNQPAPFIYERLGEKYRHYFIDEFQDTSEMQWNNLIPLISNALESEDEQGQSGSLFLVGDIKQAIYRWRGGRAEQFLNLLSLSQGPFVLQPEIRDLPTNYRSKKEIIAFNNNFFTSVSSFLNNDGYKTLFINGNRQNPSTNNEGYVQLTFLNAHEEITIDDLYCEKVLQIIKEALEESYEYRDICILTRKRKQGILLSDFLIEQDIPLISSETLLLKRNNKVAFLMRLLRHCTHPQDLENNFSILYFLGIEEHNLHTYIQQNIEHISDVLYENYEFNFEYLKHTSVYDGLEYAIKKFSLAESSDAYLSFLLDEALLVEQREDAGISTFLNYWEKKKDKLSLVAPESLNAVKIMTVHKAKGLEFPIVIFPYANTSIYEEINPKLWLPLEHFKNQNFKEVLISKKQEVVHYGREAQRRYEEEQHKLELDAFNLLYVALTRAIDSLYILTENDLTVTGAHKPQYYSGLFIHFLKEHGIWTEEKYCYTFGSPGIKVTKEKSDKLEESIPFQYSHKNRPGFRILTSAGMLWDTKLEEALIKGTTIHQLMEHITTSEDVEEALDKLQNNGIFGDGRGKYREIAMAIVGNSELKPFYQSGIRIKNECDIITENGLILRPDRLVFNGNRVSILDYKTGKRNPKYREQLYAYADALKEMGYEVDQKVIIYIDNKIQPEFI